MRPRECKRAIISAVDNPKRTVHTSAQLPTPMSPVALTEEQTEIWLAAQAGDEASCAFNESVTVHLHGALHAPMFERAWE
ncbi:MAG TPA: hypothetical protein VME66_09040, partial [Candidatus Acidoferrales bacterium]|nr:hypothetical protein [Candidatus Acidoferrales bacterium]